MYPDSWGIPIEDKWSGEFLNKKLEPGYALISPRYVKYGESKFCVNQFNTHASTVERNCGRHHAQRSSYESPGGSFLLPTLLRTLPRNFLGTSRAVLPTSSREFLRKFLGSTKTFLPKKFLGNA